MKKKFCTISQFLTTRGVSLYNRIVSAFLLVCFFSLIYTSLVAQSQIGSEININGDMTEFDWSGYSVSLSEDGSMVAIGAPGVGFSAGYVRVFRRDESSPNGWTQVGNVIEGEMEGTAYQSPETGESSHLVAGDRSGHSVSLSADGTILAVGAYLNNGMEGNVINAGHVRVYRLDESQVGNEMWRQVGADIDGEAEEDWSGYSVSLSEDGMTVAIGAPFNDGNGRNAGHVRVYNFSSNVWTQVGADINGEAAYDNSGVSVSLNARGTMMAIGVPQEGEEAGYVQVYRYSSSVWAQVGANIIGEAAGDELGHSVSLDSAGTTVAIGAISNDGNGESAGHVRVYSLEDVGGNMVWTQVGEDIDGERNSDASGYSVSLSADGSVVAIGATGNDGNGENAGHVRVYRNILDTWTQIEEDIDGEAAGDLFGFSVSLSADGTILATGAIFNDGNGVRSGHVQVRESFNKGGHRGGQCSNRRRQGNLYADPLEIGAINGRSEHNMESNSSSTGRNGLKNSDFR